MDALAKQIVALASRVHRKCPNLTSLEDLVSEGWVAALAAMKRFDPARGLKLGTFLSKRIEGAMLDHLRSLDPLTRQDHKKLETGAQQFCELRGRDSTNPWPAIEAHVTVELLFKHTGLPTTARRVTELYYLEGLTTREIAAECGLSLAYARNLVSRSRILIRGACAESRAELGAEMVYCSGCGTKFAAIGTRKYCTLPCYRKNRKRGIVAQIN